MTLHQECRWPRSTALQPAYVAADDVVAAAAVAVAAGAQVEEDICLGSGLGYSLAVGIVEEPPSRNSKVEEVSRYRLSCSQASEAAAEGSCHGSWASTSAGEVEVECIDAWPVCAYSSAGAGPSSNPQQYAPWPAGLYCRCRWGLVIVAGMESWG
jgi:hypothetical protein